VTLKNSTNAARKGIRTLLQATISLGPTLLLVAAGVPARYGAEVGVVTTTLVTVAHNLLEDKGIIGTWLRRPTPSTGPGA
jgi:hypothetical protein